MSRAVAVARPLIVWGEVAPEGTLPSIVDEAGLQAITPPERELTEEQLSRAVDLIIVRLRAARYKFTDIGAVLNRPPTTVKTRYYSIPDEVRDYYASAPLG